MKRSPSLGITPKKVTHMSDASQLETINENDRIAKWRAERLEIAETEKKERLRAKEASRIAAEEATRLNRMQTARALLPTENEIAKQKVAVDVQRQSTSKTVWAQFLTLFVVPLAACALYLTAVATPLFEAKSVVAITKPQSAQEQGSAGLLSGLATPGGLQEAFMADAYIQSQSIMDQLEADDSLISRWSSEEIDPLRRMRDISILNMSKQMQLRRFIDSRVDIQTGLLTIHVRDPDPSMAIDVANRILLLAQAQLNALNTSVFDQQVSLAQSAVDAAKADLIDAQALLLNSQIDSGEVDPRLSVAGVYDTIRQLEAEALALQSEVQKAQIAGRGESFLAQQTQELQNRTREAIELQRQKLVSDQAGSPSLNSVLMDFDRASLQVRIAEDALATAFAGLVQATNAAAQNQSLFQVVVPPRAGSTPASPNTLPVLGLLALLFGALFAFVRIVQVGRTAG